MLTSDDILNDSVYDGGKRLRRWTLVGGWPRCVEEAYAVETTDSAVIAAQDAANRALADRLAAVEAFEAAERIARDAAMNGPPSETVAVWDADGLLSTTPNPAWSGYQSAVAVVAGAAAETAALAVVRRGAPPEPRPGGDPSPEWTAYRDALALLGDA